jgi:predicted nucleic acid-binding protein
MGFFAPAAEGHGLWPWMNAPAFGRDVAPLGREVGATGFARRAPLDRKGKVVSTADLIIASAAYKEARLLHSDRDFDTIASIVDLEQEKI